MDGGGGGRLQEGTVVTSPGNGRLRIAANCDNDSARAQAHSEIEDIVSFNSL